MAHDRLPGSGAPWRGGAVLAIGSRALVAPRPGASDLPLCNEHGVPTGTSLAAGADVEIVAWLPRGPGGPRYRVRSTDALEGWVDATGVQPQPRPPAPPRVTKLPSGPAPPGGVSARPRRSSR